VKEDSPDAETAAVTQDEIGQRILTALKKVNLPCIDNLNILFA